MKNIITLATLFKYIVPKKCNIQEKLLNLIISKIPSDKLNILRLPKAVKAQSNVDLRNKMPPIVDQGNLGSCTANALCALISYLDPKMIGSRLFLYYNERDIEGNITRDTGAYIHNGVYSLVKHGICMETDWPYIIKKFTIKPSSICYIKASDHQALTVKNINNKLISMMTALNSGYPFVVGILVYQSFMSQTVVSTGMIPMPKYNEKILGGHALCVVGYDDMKQVFIVRNSWGIYWGDKGYCYIPYNYLTSTALTSNLWCITNVEK